MISHIFQMRFNLNNRIKKINNKILSKLLIISNKFYKIFQKNQIKINIKIMIMLAIGI